MRVAIIDLDGTLIDRDSAFARWADHFCAENGLDRVLVGKLDIRFRSRRQQFFAELVTSFDLAADPSEIWAEYRSLMPTFAAAFPGVREGLTALRESGWRLALLSNGEADNQNGKLEKNDLLEFFDIVRISGESGLRKPDSAAYLDAVAAMGISGGTLPWMLGDDPLMDVVGPARLGLSTAWVSHGRTWPGGSPGPDLSARSPAQALHRLSQVR
ncbi:HAD family hydrolase [Kineosporia sp. J2-2]|uniref:HAD family hydrolase n=1 Tax=Kineosporia corallincola TaxID=2835133 RepID=A0ABS5TRA7_9ACTN|nr:HAD family hydrolase [Kineosporia corallincola]MBT0773154.1 HAD family hydrolase [Kineosporia corallincola]